MKTNIREGAKIPQFKKGARVRVKGAGHYGGMLGTVVSSFTKGMVPKCMVSIDGMGGGSVGIPRVYLDPVYLARVGSLPPDPDGQNDDRGQWAQAALDAFMDATGTDEGDALSDLLADFGHWLDRRGKEFHDLASGETVTLRSELRRAEMHYREETGGLGRAFEDVL